MPLWWNNKNSGTERWSGCSTVFSVATKPEYLEDPSLETDYEKAQQDLMIAQAYALRAYCYLQLIKRWAFVTNGVARRQGPTEGQAGQLRAMRLVHHRSLRQALAADEARNGGGC